MSRRLDGHLNPIATDAAKHNRDYKALMASVAMPGDTAANSRALNVLLVFNKASMRDEI